MKHSPLIRRASVLFCAGALATGLMGFEAAQAHRASYRSTVTIQPKFQGSVNSNRRCIRNRTVVVKKVRPGPDRTVGRASTGPRGRWGLRRPGANGRYYAIVRQEVRGGYAHAHRCRSDRSRTIRV
jgi:hypothetical protein